MRTYEAMFLLDASNTDIEAASVPVRELLDRIRAEVLVLKLWDERRLAYEVKGRRRGMYLLTYFKAEPANVTAIAAIATAPPRAARLARVAAKYPMDIKISDNIGALLSEGSHRLALRALAIAPGPPETAPGPARTRGYDCLGDTR